MAARAAAARVVATRARAAAAGDVTAAARVAVATARAAMARAAAAAATEATTGAATTEASSRNERGSEGASRATLVSYFVEKRYDANSQHESNPLYRMAGSREGRAPSKAALRKRKRGKRCQALAADR